MNGKMNVSDYIFDFLIKKNVDTAFVVTGGQAMYLNDAMARRKEITPIFAHHEQTCSMAADAFSRLSGKLGVAVVTAGPGSINALNGLVGGWCDSSPMMIISGQSTLKCVKYQEKSGIRQYGIQGIYIKPFVQNAVKYFVTVDDPSKIEFYMQKAYSEALSKRKGPVWIDVPLDIQRAEVPVNLLTSYAADDLNISLNQRRLYAKKTADMIKTAKRPLIIAGQGIRSADAIQTLREFAEKNSIPIVTTRLGIDIINSDHPLYVGRPGNYGERCANIAIQTADLIISLGSRLSSASIGHDAERFGCLAKKIVVDIDEKELEKPDFKIDLKICDDVKLFLKELSSCGKITGDTNDWASSCRFLKTKYPVVIDEYKKEEEINSYYFIDKLSQMSDKNSVILVDTGSCFHVACQTWKIKDGQRFLTTGGLSSMGWWVASIGACMASNKHGVIVITGDGSLQMNIQEFATIKHNNLPVKVFVLNNDGYLLIRQTQRNFMQNRLYGESKESGVWCPDSLRIADAYGIKAVRINQKETLENGIREVLSYDGPVVCDVKVPKWQYIIPRVSSEKLPDGSLVSRKFEDMYPYLPKEELKTVINNIIKIGE